jgi:regulator of protease activity HflC (stomatin/prohibitin superfamily)
MNSNSTRSVQAFVRFIVFIISFVFLSLVFVGLMGFSSSDIFVALSVPLLVTIAFISITISRMFFILPEWEAMVVLRLGKFDGVRGAGFFIIPPFIYSVASIVDLRIITQQVEATATLTKDNVPTKVTAAIEYKVENPQKATIDVQDYKSSVTWLATEALKNTIGSLDLKDLLSERDQIAESLKFQIDKGAAVYGVDVKAVRITDLDTPKSLIEELAVIARARRAAEAKKVQAEAEIIVAEKLSKASKMLDSNKHAMRLRELQILNEMSKEESSMVIIYPYGDRDGANIAGATAGRIKKAKVT